MFIYILSFLAVLGHFIISSLLRHSIYIWCRFIAYECALVRFK